MIIARGDTSAINFLLRLSFR